jgi:hypothetical protein
MVMARNTVPGCWRRKVLRWSWLLGVCALAGCALTRRDAPPTLFSSATPVGFPADVRYAGRGRNRSLLRVFDSKALTGQSLVVSHGWCMQ